MPWLRGGAGVQAPRQSQRDVGDIPVRPAAGNQPATVEFEHRSAHPGGHIRERDRQTLACRRLAELGRLDGGQGGALGMSWSAASTHLGAQAMHMHGILQPWLQVPALLYVKLGV